MSGLFHCWVWWLMVAVTTSGALGPGPGRGPALPAEPKTTYGNHCITTRQGNPYYVHTTWLREKGQWRTAYLIVIPGTTQFSFSLVEDDDLVVPTPGKITLGRTVLSNGKKRIPITEKHFIFIYTGDDQLKPVEGFKPKHLRYWDGRKADPQMFRVEWWAQKIEPLIDEESNQPDPPAP